LLSEITSDTFILRRNAIFVIRKKKFLEHCFSLASQMSLLLSETPGCSIFALQMCEIAAFAESGIPAWNCDMNVHPASTLRFTAVYSKLMRIHCFERPPDLLVARLCCLTLERRVSHARLILSCACVLFIENLRAFIAATPLLACAL
jgi:hypothetical protein